MGWGGRLEVEGLGVSILHPRINFSAEFTVSIPFCFKIGALRGATRSFGNPSMGSPIDPQPEQIKSRQRERSN